MRGLAMIACTTGVNQVSHAVLHIQVWTLSQPTPAFTLDGHDKGVNSVDYFSGGESSHQTSTCSLAGSEPHELLA